MLNNTLHLSSYLEHIKTDTIYQCASNVTMISCALAIVHCQHTLQNTMPQSCRSVEQSGAIA